MKKYEWKRYLFYDIHRLIGWLPFVLWFRPKIMYISDEAKQKIKPFKKDGGAVIVANHTTHNDPPYMQMLLIKRHKNIISANDLLTNKFVNKIIRLLGGIMIDRNNFSLKSFKEIHNLLVNDHLVCLYPEGRIIKEEEGIGEFKSGFVSFAFSSGKPIIPVYIKKRHNILRRLKIVIGEPIYLDHNKKLNREEVASLTRKKVIELKDYYNKGEKK